MARMIDLLGHGGLPHPVHDARFYAGVGVRRLLAFGIDFVLIVAVGVVAAGLFGVATLGAGFLLVAPVLAATGVAYRIASIARWSATPGMVALGVELRRRDGERFGPAEAVAHTLLFTAMFWLVVPQVLSVAAMATLPAGRGLHDVALGSAVIHRPT
jgi:uncharacterized RDD family membrane protein YckC